MALTDHLAPVGVAVAVGAITFPAMSKVDETLGKKKYIPNGLGVVVGAGLAAWALDNGNELLAAAGFGFAAASAAGLAAEFKTGATTSEMDACSTALGHAKSAAASAPAAPAATKGMVGLSQIVGALPAHQPAMMGSSSLLRRDPRLQANERVRSVAGAVTMPSWATSSRNAAYSSRLIPAAQATIDVFTEPSSNAFAGKEYFQKVMAEVKSTPANNLALVNGEFLGIPRTGPGAHGYYFVRYADLGSPAPLAKPYVMVYWQPNLSAKHEPTPAEAMFLTGNTSGGFSEVMAIDGSNPYWVLTKNASSVLGKAPVASRAPSPYSAMMRPAF